MSAASPSTPLDPWSETLLRLQRACGADALVLSSHDIQRRAATIVRAIEIAPEFTHAFGDRGGAVLPWLDSSEPVPMNGGVLKVDDARHRASFFFREWMAPQGFAAVLVAVLLRTESQIVCLLLLRRKRGGPFPDGASPLLAASLPGLALAWRLQHEAMAARIEATQSWRVLDSLSPGVLLVDERARVRRANRAARALLGKGHVIGVRGGVLVCRRTSDAAKVRLALSQIIAGEVVAGAPPSQAIALASPDDGAPLQMILAPFPGDSGHPRLILACVCAVGATPPPPAQWLIDLYGLSRVDADICRHMCRGLTPDEIAGRMHSSVHTVRAHMKRIFARTGVRRQVELVRLLMAGLSALSLETMEAANDADKESGHAHGTLLPPIRGGLPAPFADREWQG